MHSLCTLLQVWEHAIDQLIISTKQCFCFFVYFTSTLFIFVGPKISDPESDLQDISFLENLHIVCVH